MSYRGKTPENADFVIAGAILDERKLVWESDKVSWGGGGGRDRKTACPELVSCESQILTLSTGRRGILIGRFIVNHRHFGVMQRRSR